MQESPAKLPVEASSLSSTETEYADYSSRRFSPVKIDDMKWALFVGDLALNVDRQDLIDLFSQHGTVLDAVVKRASNGNMTKHGFVAMSSQVEMEECLKLDKKLILFGNKLRLSQSRRHSYLKVSNLDVSVTAPQLASFFRAYGDLYENDTHVGFFFNKPKDAFIARDDGSNDVDSCGIQDRDLNDETTGSSYQIGIVHFKERSSAAYAKRQLHGKSLYVDWAPLSLVTAAKSRLVNLNDGEGQDDTNQNSSVPPDKADTRSNHIETMEDVLQSDTNYSRKIHRRPQRFRPTHHSLKSRGPSGGKGGILSLYTRYKTSRHVDVDEGAIFQTFQQFGNVTGVILKKKMWDEASESFHGYAFVHYEVSSIGRNSALHAISHLNGSVNNGVHYIVEPSHNFAQLDSMSLQPQMPSISPPFYASPSPYGITASLMYPSIQCTGNGGQFFYHTNGGAFAVPQFCNISNGGEESYGYLSATNNNGANGTYVLENNGADTVLSNHGYWEDGSIPYGFYPQGFLLYGGHSAGMELTPNMYRDCVHYPAISQLSTAQMIPCFPATNRVTTCDPNGIYCELPTNECEECMECEECEKAENVELQKEIAEREEIAEGSSDDCQNGGDSISTL